MTINRSSLIAELRVLPKLEAGDVDVPSGNYNGGCVISEIFNDVSPVFAYHITSGAVRAVLVPASEQRIKESQLHLGFIFILYS